MSRLRLTLAAGACVVAVGVGAALGSGTATGATAPPPRHELRAFVCQKALDPPARAVSIQAVMRPLTGTASMQLRFDLLRQARPGGRFRPVRGRLLGSWVSPSDATLGQRPGDIWIVNHPVVNLAAPSTYRFRVSFRWFGSSGQQLGTAVESSSNCYQPELRADLLVRAVTVTALPSGQDAYVAEIANRGRTGAGPFGVELAGAGDTMQTATVARLGPRSTMFQRFVAPACTAGGGVTVTVDRAAAVDEYNFANNALTVPCPTPSSPSGSSTASG